MSMTEIANKMFGTSGSGWIVWIHEENTTKSHCETCKKLDRRWFREDKMPQMPLHQFCHCFTASIAEPIGELTTSAECPIEKIRDYIYAQKGIENGKNDIYERQWGYKKEDSEWLIKEFERQASAKYAKGEYELGLINKYGQRVTIIIELSTPNGSTVRFYTGWMVEEDGKIKHTTPFAGYVEKN